MQVTYIEPRETLQTKYPQREGDFQTQLRQAVDKGSDKPHNMSGVDENEGKRVGAF
jgi:hypothetical protein